MGYYCDDNSLRGVIMNEIMPNIKNNQKYTKGFLKSGFDDLHRGALSKESMIRFIKIASEYGINSELVDKEKGNFEIQFFY